MGRAQQGVVNTEAKGQFGTDTGNAAKELNTLMPSYQNELANPGLTDAQKASQVAATTGGVGAAFGSEAEGASNRAARTNNAAGLTSNEDALARQRMITSGNLAAQNEAGFTAAARSDRDKAQGGIGQLFGENLSAGNQVLGTQANNAQTPGFWDTFGNALAKSLGTVGGSASSGGSSIGFG